MSLLPCPRMSSPLSLTASVTCVVASGVGGSGQVAGVATQFQSSADVLVANALPSSSNVELSAGLTAPGTPTTTSAASTTAKSANETRSFRGVCSVDP